ncbi:hypothetical protein BC943DRAFT_93483 [Umbelopsis sp. AD052]|nr:hypothetical protein BC943DRAFT_93483 [Umbelopsis sp. AD052]
MLQSSNGRTAFFFWIAQRIQLQLSCQDTNTFNMDIFPVDDDNLNVDVLDVFLPFDSRKHKLLPRSAAPRPLNAAIKPSSPQDSGMERTKSSTSPNLYCTACKKKFSNEATWNAHLKSAKHLQNEKASAKSTTINLGANQKSTSGQSNPAVAQVSMKLKQAMNIVASKPSRAVGALWTLAQEFFKLKRPRESAQVLNDLIELLETLQSQPTKAPDADTLTSAQISGTLYLSRLALSRLYLTYWDDQSLELARKLFVKALHGKWKIDEQQLNDVATNCSSISIPKLLTAAEDLLRIYIEKVLSKPIKPKTDVNQMLPVILSEGEMLFSLVGTKIGKPREISKEASSQQMAVAMCAMTIVIHQHLKHSEGELTGYQNLSKLYLNLGAQGSAAEALMERSLVAAQQCDPEELPSSMIDAMIALIICLEIGKLWLYLATFDVTA